MNAYSLELTDYIMREHPDRIDDQDFIRTRGRMASKIFEKCSRSGMTVDQAQHEAHQVLYAGLIFSPYRMVEEIINEKFHYSEDNEEMGIFTMQMLERVKPLINHYHPDDEFRGTHAYVELCEHVEHSINEYLRKNGL